ncbi:hypothetical protein lerEdw1_011334 [Lerista edwardsae]|nr:hypothetical protein lerEdw1_011334 [Lerista edwardsae]
MRVPIINCEFCVATGEIVTQNEEVELGGNVTLRCILTSRRTDNVFQVTWQKQIDRNFENMAVNQNSKDINILEPYRHLLNFTVLDLNDTAITFWHVSTKENGCYRCMFHAFPSPAEFSTITCLSVYDQLTAFVHYDSSNGHVIANCSATGFPRPSISWVIPPDEKNEKEMVNPNGTVSVMSSVRVNTPSSKYGQELICKVTHRGNEIFFKVPLKEKGCWNPVPIVLTVLAVVILIVILIVVVCWRRHRKK